jgi:hypothetical protein
VKQNWAKPKAGRIFSRILWSKLISLNREKRILYTVVEGILVYGCEIELWLSD